MPPKTILKSLQTLKASSVALLAPSDRNKFLASLSQKQARLLVHHWPFWARPSQLRPLEPWHIWLQLAGRGYGKLLDAETMIPTPDGWSVLKNLVIGDTIFDEAGKPCRILQAFDAIPEDAYRLTFSDGSQIDSCADHQWMTWTYAERKAFLRSQYEAKRTQFPEHWPLWKGKRCLGGGDLPKQIIEQALQLRTDGRSARSIATQLGIYRRGLTRHFAANRYVHRTARIHADALGPRVRTTRDIVETLFHGTRGDLNHCIPCTAPLVLPTQSLPLHPYILGLWLGDGTTRDGTITAHELDQPHIRHALAREGFITTIYADPQRIGTRGLLVTLRAAGVLGRKHVPPIYLRASIEQRLDLLRGLMDTDGNVEQGNTVSFVNTNRQLIDAAIELVHSLGMKTRVASGIGKCNGKQGKQFWRVQFTATINPFSLPRKAERIRLGGKQALRNHHRMIVSVERIAPRPMRCLTVDSPHSLFLAGRAMIPTHNTRTGAETVKAWDQEGYKRMALVAATPADARDVMLEGESGLLSPSVYPEKDRPTYQPSKRRICWPSGAVATIYSAHKPDDKSGLRGPQHEKAWGDEPAKWQYPGNLDQLLFGMRIGDNPQVILTGTPRSTPLIRDLVRRAKDPGTGIVLSTGTSYENMANLADIFINTIIKKFEGTRLGKQELLALLLDDVMGALWTRAMIDRMAVFDAPEFERKVIAVDPGVSDGTNEQAAETGIIAAGLGLDGKAYCLEDCSLREHPSVWAQAAVAAYHRHEADVIVAEANNGGEMVRLTIQSLPGCQHLPVKLVHASRGKLTRAEPVSLLCEQGLIKHLGVFPDLEDQLVTWVPGEASPDRLDAYVWAFTELMVGHVAFGITGGGAVAPEQPETIGDNGHAQEVDSAIIRSIRRGSGGFGFR